MQLDEIRIDGGTQARAKMNEDTVREYADFLKEGVKFPPVIVFDDGVDYWLADGFNRYYAHKSIKRNEIDVDIKDGSRLDAKLYACGANANHGQPRTAEDKKNAVLMVLSEPEWKGFSLRDVAKHCSVAHSFVSKVKESLENKLPKVFSENTPKTKPPKKTLPKQDDPEYDERDDMRETIATLNEELEVASRAAAAGVLAEGMEEAQAIMERQAAEIKILQAENDGLKATRDTMMVEIRELKKQCAYYQKKLKGTEK
jgi:hypothetical protein